MRPTHSYNETETYNKLPDFTDSGCVESHCESGRSVETCRYPAQFKYWLTDI